MLDLKEEVRELAPKRVRLQFSVEDKKQTEQILHAWESFVLGKQTERMPEDYTRGHFKRGVI